MYDALLAVPLPEEEEEDKYAALDAVELPSDKDDPYAALDSVALPEEKAPSRRREEISATPSFWGEVAAGRGASAALIAKRNISQALEETQPTRIDPESVAGQYLEGREKHNKPLFKPEYSGAYWIGEALGKSDPGGTLAGLGEGALKGAADLFSSFTTPENIATLGVGGLKKVALKLVGGAFSGLAAWHAPEAWKELNEAKSVADRTRIATTTLAGIALPLLAFKGNRQVAKTIDDAVNETISEQVNKGGETLSEKESKESSSSETGSGSPGIVGETITRSSEAGEGGTSPAGKSGESTGTAEATDGGPRNPATGEGGLVATPEGEAGSPRPVGTGDGSELGAPYSDRARGTSAPISESTTGSPEGGTTTPVGVTEPGVTSEAAAAKPAAAQTTQRKPNLTPLTEAEFADFDSLIGEGKPYATREDFLAASKRGRIGYDPLGDVVSDAAQNEIALRTTGKPMAEILKEDIIQNPQYHYEFGRAYGYTHDDIATFLIHLKNVSKQRAKSHPAPPSADVHRQIRKELEGIEIEVGKEQVKIGESVTEVSITRKAPEVWQEQWNRKALLEAAIECLI